MQETIQRGDRDRFVVKNLSPAAERLIRWRSRDEGYNGDLTNV